MLKLSNGTTVSKDGVIVHQDGVVQRMEDGEEVRLEDLQ